VGLTTGLVDAFTDYYGDWLMPLLRQPRPGGADTEWRARQPQDPAVQRALVPGYRGILTPPEPSPLPGASPPGGPHPHNPLAHPRAVTVSYACCVRRALTAWAVICIAEAVCCA